MAIDGAVVGSGAEFDVREHGDHCIDRHNGAIVASFPERGAGLVYGTNDLVDGGGPVVDKLVTNADRIDHTPVTVDSAADCLN